MDERTHETTAQREKIIPVLNSQNLLRQAIVQLLVLSFFLFLSTHLPLPRSIYLSLSTIQFITNSLIPLFMKFFNSSQKLALSLTLLVGSLTPTVASVKTTAPDFAYPQTVVANALTNLKKALAEKDDTRAIRQLLDYTVANNSIGLENVEGSLAKIKEIYPSFSDPSSQAILNLLQAKLYAALYNLDKYTYDSRTLPLLPLPDNYDEWSGNQFRQVISDFCDKAIADPTALQQVKLSELSEIITINRESLIYMPTLFDFIAYSTIDIRSSLSQFSSCLGLMSLTPKNTFMVAPGFSPSNAETKKILDTYAALLMFHRNNPAAEIYSDIQRISFVTNNIYSNLHDEASSTAQDLLKRLYDEYFKTSEFSGEALIALAGKCNNGQSKDSRFSAAEIYDMCKQSINAYPNFSKNGCIENITEKLLQKFVNVSCPSLVVPGQEFTLTVKCTNVPSVTVNIYKVNSSSSIKKENLQGAVPAYTYLAEFNQSAPFRATSEISAKIDKCGYYAIVPQTDFPHNNVNYQVINCSELSAGTIDLEPNNEIFVINPFTGKPVKNANVDYTPYNKKTVKNIGATDSDGFLALNSDLNGNLQPWIGDDKYAPQVNVWSTRSRAKKSDWNISVAPFTDLSLYHPGDTIKWSAVVYEYLNSDHRLVTAKDMRVILFNANNLPIDTVNCSSDNWGRINGAFSIPENELTGSYRLYFTDASTDKWAGNTYVTVSDYKLPTFYIEMDKTAVGVPVEGGATVSGTAKTYSGVPLSGIPVEAVISASMGRGWFRSQDVDFCSLADTTDTSGHFSMVLSKELVDNSPAPAGLFTASITATSLTGESQQASTSFTIGKAYAIVSSLPSVVETSSPISLSQFIKIENSQGDKIDSPLSYQLSTTSDNNATVMSGPVTADVNWSKTIPGKYSLKVYATTLSADTLTTTVTLYGVKSSVSPSDDPLWSPKNNGNLESETGRFKIPVFACTDKVSALLLVTSGKTEITRKWLTLSKGNNSIDVNIPDNMEKAFVQLLASYKLTSSTLNFELINKSKVKSLDIKAESFRDHLIPGQNETWTFSTVNAQGQPTEAAFVLAMHNAALDAISPYRFDLSFNSYRLPDTYLSYYSSGISGRGIWERFHDGHCSSIKQPEFNIYGLPFLPHLKQLNNIMYKTSARVSVVEVREDAGSLSNVTIRGYGASRADATADASPYLLAEKEEASDESEAKEAPQAEQPSFAYRDSETALAFFSPVLTTNADGTLSYSFTVPNANTTWAFNAAAYSRDLASNTFSRSIVANKPLMVQPNLPRFLRIGDKATVLAAVINNSEDEMEANVVVELFNPTDMSVTATYPQTLLLPAHATQTISTAINASASSSFIGYRIKASTEAFADGEQSLIPVLAASSPVIETLPFYIPADTLAYQLQIPDYPADSRVTLQYCDNPTWYVVTALPGISAKECRTAPQAASAIFSAAVADGILRTCPQVKTALRQWTQSDKSDSTLTSMLQRNSDLKTFLLQATPWMLDAQSDTERMQRLALLLDSKNINETYKSAIDLLSKLQRADGGWAWINQYDESSEWATEQTLNTLGRLNQLGFLPSNSKLSAMIDRALGFYQTVICRDYKKYPKSDYSDFVMNIDRFPSFKPSSTASKIIATTVQNRVTAWKRSGLIEKANSAIILYRHGYKPVAKQILASMKQFAKSTPTKGLWWPLIDDVAGGSMTELTLTSRALEAYHLIEPGSPVIDQIRQWLILQKEARDWGNGTSASEVAAAVLLTSPTWVNAATPAEVRVGKSAITPSESESTLGYFRSDISELRPSGKTLSISKTSATPAWGAIYSQSTQTITDIKSASTDAMSIEKRLYKAVGENWVEGTELTVGDKVKVELLIRTTRAMDYVAISDMRPACFEPVDQLPSSIFSEGLCFYRENGDDATNIFISRMPKGTYLLTYEMWVNNAGTFSSGIATIQSQYAPQLTSHSAGCALSATPAR